MANRFLTSITRASDLAGKSFEIDAIPRDQWATGDFVACEVVGKPGPLYRIELVSGRRTPVLPGDTVIGAFGKRAATLECVGDWRDIGDDLKLHQLTGAGLLGKVTSNSNWVGRPMELLYRGHAVRESKLNIADYIPQVDGSGFDMPVVLVVGTSMSAGKTLTGRIIIDQLKRLGYSVTAAKLTGAAGYKDALTYRDAGADTIFDYVDAGLVSTVCPREEFDAGFETLLGMIAAAGSQIMVGEIGASPMEPYNGAAAIERLGSNIALVALCASDAYAAEGFCSVCPCKPDFVTGPAANNSASSALTESLTGLTTFDLGSEAGLTTLRNLISEKLPAVQG